MMPDERSFKEIDRLIEFHRFFTLISLVASFIFSLLAILIIQALALVVIFGILAIAHQIHWSYWRTKYYTLKLNEENKWMSKKRLK